jgi:uncharacterized damage-inducible protein DinB
MKHLILILSCLLMTNLFAQNEIIPTFLEKWQNSKTYLIEIAQSMPEDKYNFKPTEREMTFGAQLLHIKGNMDWLSASYFTTEKFDKKVDENNYSKAEIIAMLEKSFDDVYAIIKNTDPDVLNEEVAFFAGPKSKLQILNLLQDHVSHHRGQIIVYLNLNGIKPPKYVGW